MAYQQKIAICTDCYRYYALFLFFSLQILLVSTNATTLSFYSSNVCYHSKMFCVHELLMNQSNEMNFFIVFCVFKIRQFQMNNSTHCMIKCVKFLLLLLIIIIFIDLFVLIVLKQSYLRHLSYHKIRQPYRLCLLLDFP